MVTLSQYRNVFLFLGAYLLLSWPLFLYLNREVLTGVLSRLALIDPMTLVFVLGGFVILVGLLRAHEGVDRYTLFLSSPGSVVSFVMALSFVVAAVSWWALPEIVFHLELDVTLNQILLLILACQAPMLVFLSLMTVLSKAASV